MSESQSGPSKRATPSRKRSRAVSNLTEEQIQHKRNVDRKAQRAFRQRTKNCISNLEQQFSQLQETCSQLRETCAHKDQDLSSMREQNKTLLNCLEAISELITTAFQAKDSGKVGRENGSQGQSHQEVGETREQTEAHTPEHRQEPTLRQASEAHNEASPAPTDYQLDPEPHREEPAASHSTPDGRPSTPEDNLIANLDEQGNDDYTYNGVDETYRVTQSTHPGLLSPPGSHHPPRRSSHAPDYTISQTRPPTSLMGCSDTSVEFETPCSDMIDSNPYVTSNAVFTVLPPHQSPTCPLDQILLDFLSSRREMLTSRVMLELVIGPQKPAVRALVNNDQAEAGHSVSGIMSGVLCTFPSLQLAEKLAFFFLMCHTMRWQIYPTKESYFAMPSWLRPTVTQITVPHAAWIDNIPWPGVRDILIENPEEYPFQLFSDYYSQNVTVNWKFDGLDAVSDMDAGGVLHSIFEKHIRNLKNWTVSREFQARFPSMTSAIYSRD